MQKKKISYLLLILLFVSLMAGCGEKKRRVTDGSDVYAKQEPAQTQEEEEAEEEDEVQGEETLFAVTAIDEQRKTLTLRNCENAVEVPYAYTGGTYIKDKYGKDMTVNQLSLGELVTIDVRGEKLSLVQISQEAFSYDDLHNFVLDKEMQSLTVGDSVYFFDENLLAYQGESKVPLFELSEYDTVCIKGVGQQIYTLQVTAGHGTVVLEDVELFLGGYITIGNMVSQKITPQMRIELPVGTYLLSVANEGYGGSREITVEADQETKVSLDELKGDGPKLCQIEFELKTENAEVFLDGEQVDVSQPIQVRYGTHRLTAKAEGYVDWARNLIVNSAAAKITIELTTEEEAKEEETISTVNPSGSSNNNGNNNSNTNGNNNSNSNNNNNSNNSNNSNNNTNSNNTSNNNGNRNNNTGNSSNNNTNGNNNSNRNNNTGNSSNNNTNSNNRNNNTTNNNTGNNNSTNSNRNNNTGNNSTNNNSTNNNSNTNNNNSNSNSNAGTNNNNSTTNNNNNSNNHDNNNDNHENDHEDDHTQVHPL